MCWRIRPGEDDAVLRSFLERDRDWAAYLLGDLEPPYRQHARFFLAARQHDDEALLLVYEPPEFSVLLSMGAPEGLTAMLTALPGLPKEASIVIPTSHRAAFDEHYTIDVWKVMWRMALGPADLRSPTDSERAERLGMDDLAAIQALLATNAGTTSFTPAMLREGVYFGIRDQGRLVAIAGTHVIAMTSRVAAVGNVYTLAEVRGRGYAGSTTGAVTRALFARGCERVVLNVEAANIAAMRVYERLGFVHTHDYWETNRAHRRS